MLRHVDLGDTCDLLRRSHNFTGVDQHLPFWAVQTVAEPGRGCNALICRWSSSSGCDAEGCSESEEDKEPHGVRLVWFRLAVKQVAKRALRNARLVFKTSYSL